MNQFGFPNDPDASFSGKRLYEITRLGVYGPRGPLGDFSGKASTLSTDNVIDVPLASITVTALAPNALRDVLVDVFAGQEFVLQEFAPTIHQDIVSQIPVATITITPLAPTSEQDLSDDVISDIPTASVVITALAPSAVQDVVVTPPVAAFDITPLAPTVEIGSPEVVIDVPLAVISLTPLAPTITASGFSEEDLEDIADVVRDILMTETSVDGLSIVGALRRMAAVLMGNSTGVHINDRAKFHAIDGSGVLVEGDHDGRGNRSNIDLHL